MRPLKHSALLLFLLPLFYVHCDTYTPLPVSSNQSSILSIDVSPSLVQFTLKDDGYKDTTVTFEIRSEISKMGSSEKSNYVVTKNSTRETVASGTLIDAEDNMYNASFDLNTSTTQIQDFIVQVSVYDEYGNINTAEYNIELIGFPNARPEILMVENPNEVIIPSGNDELIIPFTAKVKDADGQSNIDQVFIEFINSDGSILVPNPNTLLDNGLNEDVAANDSVYTIAFKIDSNNTPANRTARYFAVDIAGLFSDTLTTTFNIVEN